MPHRLTSETGYLSLQINIICLLLALLGVTIITQHPDWFGGVPAKGEMSAAVYSR
jgi:hypothetical protein